MTLVEVLVAVVLLVAIFVFVAEQMIASSWAESKASQRSVNVTAANYFLAIMHGEPNIWKFQAADVPQDPCGNLMTAFNDGGPGIGSWHTPPACGLAPTQVTNVQYQWAMTNIVGDRADITVWVQSVIDGKTDQYELNGFTHRTPPVNWSSTATPTPTPMPTTPPPSPTTPPPSTPPPSPTTPPPSTPPPSPTAHPSPTSPPPTTPPPSPTSPPPSTPPPTPTPTPTATPIPI